MDPESQEDTGESYRQIKNTRQNEKVFKNQKRKFFRKINIYNSIVFVPSRIFRAVWICDEQIQSFLQWYSLRFLPVVWVVFSVLYYVSN